MAYRAYRSDRRFRRRRWLLIVVSLAAVIAVIALLVSRQTEQRGAVEFFAAADESSDLHVRASADLESALSSIGVIDRQDLTRRLAKVAETASAADLVLAVDVPSRIGESYGTMATASSEWKNGAAELDSTIGAIMDGTLVEGALAQLQASLDRLRVGDAAYSLFLGSISSLPEDIDVPPLIPVVYINPDAQDPLLYDAQTLVLRIQTSYDLSPHHDVAVTAMTDPKPVGESGGIPVVPLSETMDVVVIVSNEGNEDETSVTVTLDLFNIDTGATSTAGRNVRNLAAGASTTVMFGDIDVTPGGLYQAKVTVTIENDIDPDNDMWEMIFIWRAES